MAWLCGSGVLSNFQTHDYVKHSPESGIYSVAFQKFTPTILNYKVPVNVQDSIFGAGRKKGEKDRAKRIKSAMRVNCLVRQLRYAYMWGKWSCSSFLAILPPENDAALVM